MKISKKNQTETTEKAPKKGLLSKLGLKKKSKKAKEEEKPVEEAPEEKPVEEAPEEKPVDPEPAKEDTRELEKPAESMDTEATKDEREQPEKKAPTSPLFCGCL